MHEPQQAQRAAQKRGPNCTHHRRRSLEAVQHDGRRCDTGVHHGLAEANGRRGGAVRRGASDCHERLTRRGRRRVGGILRYVLHLRLQHLGSRNRTGAPVSTARRRASAAQGASNTRRAQHAAGASITVCSWVLTSAASGLFKSSARDGSGAHSSSAAAAAPSAAPRSAAAVACGSHVVATARRDAAASASAARAGAAAARP